MERDLEEEEEESIASLPPGQISPASLIPNALLLVWEELCKNPSTHNAKIFQGTNPQVRCADYQALEEDIRTPFGKAIRANTRMTEQKIYRTITMIVKERSVNLYDLAISQFIELTKHAFVVESSQSSQETPSNLAQRCLSVHIDFQRQHLLHYMHMETLDCKKVEEILNEKCPMPDDDSNSQDSGRLPDSTFEALQFLRLEIEALIKSIKHRKKDGFPLVYQNYLEAHSWERFESNILNCLVEAFKPWCFTDSTLEKAKGDFLYKRSMAGTRVLPFVRSDSRLSSQLTISTPSRYDPTISPDNSGDEETTESARSSPIACTPLTSTQANPTPQSSPLLFDLSQDDGVEDEGGSNNESGETVLRSEDEKIVTTEEEEKEHKKKETKPNVHKDDEPEEVFDSETYEVNDDREAPIPNAEPKEEAEKAPAPTKSADVRSNRRMVTGLEAFDFDSSQERIPKRQRREESDIKEENIKRVTNTKNSGCKRNENSEDSAARSRAREQENHQYVDPMERDSTLPPVSRKEKKVETLLVDKEESQAIHTQEFTLTQSGGLLEGETPPEEEEEDKNGVVRSSVSPQPQRHAEDPISQSKEEEPADDIRESSQNEEESDDKEEDAKDVSNKQSPRFKQKGGTTINKKITSKFQFNRKRKRRNSFHQNNK